MSIEAMKQALEALEWPLERLVNLCNNSASCSNTEEVIEAEAALERLYKARQAIAEAERHVSYVCPNCHWSLEKQVRTHTLEDVKKIESKWSGLTEDDLASCKSDEFVVFAKTIEAKLKEKNNGN